MGGRLGPARPRRNEVEAPFGASTSDSIRPLVRVECGLAGLTVDELEDELATLAAHLAAGMCRFLELVAELDRRGGFAAEGAGSCAEWLSWRCALSPRSARQHVRVARCLGVWPLPGLREPPLRRRHHVRHRARGGESTLENLVLLCRRHHRAVHEGGYQVDAEGHFFYPWGVELEPVPRLPRGDPAALTERNRRLAIDARTCEPGLGDRLDPALAVDDMLAIERKAARARASVRKPRCRGDRSRPHRC